MSNKLHYLVLNHSKISFSTNDWSLYCLLLWFYCQNSFLPLNIYMSWNINGAILVLIFSLFLFFFTASCNYKLEGTKKKNCQEGGKFIIIHEKIFMLLRCGEFLFVCFGLGWSFFCFVLFQKECNSSPSFSGNTPGQHLH